MRRGGSGSASCQTAVKYRYEVEEVKAEGDGDAIVEKWSRSSHGALSAGASLAGTARR